MTWIQFFMWSVLIYAFYFGFNILLDFRKRLRVNSDNGAEDVLHFTESQAPVIVKNVKKVRAKPKKSAALTGDDQKKTNTSMASKQDVNTSKAVDKAVEANGVDLGGLFMLARKEAIVISNKIDFTTP